MHLKAFPIVTIQGRLSTPNRLQVSTSPTDPHPPPPDWTESQSSVSLPIGDISLSLLYAT